MKSGLLVACIDAIPCLHYYTIDTIHTIINRHDDLSGMSRRVRCQHKSECESERVKASTSLGSVCVCFRVLCLSSRPLDGMATLACWERKGARNYGVE